MPRRGTLLVRPVEYTLGCTQVFNLPTSSTDGTRNTGNILVNTRTFNIKLIDFGCALEYTGKPYPNHKYRGAYDYWPPEVKGEAAFEGKTTNVYHLGKLLQKMFPGCRPRVFNLPTSSTDGTRNTGNILVNTRTFNIKLIDFGCALEYTGKPYPNHKYRGAYDYWPPEVKGEAAFEGKTTNVYHLGKLLQKMFPGCRPRVSQGESSDKNTVTHS
ncbi:putative serine/threonine-protein kinase pim-1-like [Triplophysa rosa]|uniref:non-specific serine/threonine protein kinase n=1 Tax=Triplophysa rosa TaxID=992332 RepID=A0A9W7WHI5_TRIRA|nr:putative serine/threonine-protein kinase pim-1-like [Triplophysa rosa]